jgi:NaMN:DMB phosphoribosyltransferase
LAAFDVSDFAAEGKRVNAVLASGVFRFEPTPDVVGAVAAGIDDDGDGTAGVATGAAADGSPTVWDGPTTTAAAAVTG